MPIPSLLFVHAVLADMMGIYACMDAVKFAANLEIICNLNYEFLVILLRVSEVPESPSLLIGYCCSVLN